ncbi:MAG TPA: lipid A biosynthesis acyltransferase [Planctomycetota bacterium]|nr:lipid A biosynthesis acyltransferase [Planctomycetota bacterium]
MNATSPRPATWLNRRERGTVLGIRAAFRFATLLGRTTTKPLVAFVALWYCVFDRRAVRASRDWLRRCTGRAPGFWRVYRHLRTFAQVTLDRVFLVTGRTRALTFSRTGHDLLERQAATGRGAMLIGAHLGSFEAMRARGDSEALRIQILGYFANSRRINALLSELNPRQAAQVIHVGDDRISVMARVQECLEQGQFVATLADRTGLDERAVEATFFGETARFSGGPFLLASILHCPVYLVFGLYRAPNRYDLFCEPFAERIDLPRRDREAALRACVQRYAGRVEHHARKAPDNWFNFFDFWAASPAPTPAPTHHEEART